MMDFGRGIKAGIAAGIIYGIILGILEIILTASMWSTIAVGYNGLTPTVELVLSILVPIIFIKTLIVGIIGGTIFGLIYAAIYNSLPGSSSVAKGIVLAIIFWLIFSVGIGFAVNRIFGMTYYILDSIIIGFIGSITWGYLLGKFWDKYGSEEPIRPAY